MGRHFRFILIFLCYGLLPAVLITEGGRAWLEQQFDGQVQQRRDALYETVQGMRDDIIRQRPRDRLIFSLRDSLGRRPVFDDHAVDEARRWLEEKHPGLVEMVCLSADELNLFAEPGGRKSPGKFRIMGTGETKYRFLYTTLARFLDLKFNDNQGLANAMSSRLKLLKQVLGERIDPSFVAGNRSRFLRIVFQDRPVWFFWDYVENFSANGSARRAIMFCYVDEQVYRQQFGPEGILASLRNLNELRIIGMVHRDDSQEIARLEAQWRGFGSVVERARRSQEELLQPTCLIVASPVGSGERQVFFAIEPLQELTLRRDRLLNWIRSVTLILLVLFALLLAAIHYGRLQWYISIRLQLAALFLLAALIPLCAIFYLGYQHVMKSRQNIRGDTIAYIRNQTRSVEDVMADAKQNMLAQGLELINMPMVRQAYRTPPEKLDRDRLAKMVQQHFGVLDSNGLARDGMLEDAIFFDLTGETILSSMSRPRGILRDIMQGLSRDLLREVCAQKGIAYNPPDNGNKLLGNMLHLMDNPIEMAIMRNRGVIHSLDLFGERITFMFEPVFDGERPLGTMAVIFNINGFAKKALSTVIEENWMKRSASNQRNPRFVTLVAGHISFTYRKYPDLRLFTDQLQDLFQVIVDEGLPREGLVDLQWGVDSGEVMLAWGTPMKEIPDYVIIGMIPERFVDEEYGRKLRFYILVFLLAVLVALAIALVISVKFIHPVKLVQKGVRAITEGDLEYRMRIDSRDELGDLAQIFNRMVAGLQEKERMSRYVSEFVLDEVKKDQDDGEGEEKKATILFADIRGFTALSESHPPAVIVRMLNEYLELMTGVIRRNGGVVDKFIGDAIMAVFYPDHPKGAREDEVRAVITALQMRDELNRFNAERSMLGWFEIENGIGINTGDVISGNIGARDYRVDFTVIGDHVNIAARLESASKEGKHTRIVISERTWQAVRTLIEAERMDATRVKGKSHDVIMYEVVSLRKLADYLPMLEAPEPSTRVQGLRLAAVLDDPGLIEHAARLLRSGEMAVRHEAAFALARFPGNSRTGEELMKALDSESDEMVRATLIKLIGEVGRDEDRIAMQRYLGDDSPRVRANAIEAIGRARDRTAVIDTLCGFINDPNNRIRANACVMLWSLGDTSGLDVLMTMTTRPEELMRASGAWGIGEIATREKIAELRLAGGTTEKLISPEFFAQLDGAVECLHKLLDDPDLMVQRNAIKGLGKVGNRRSVHHLIRKYQDCSDDEIRMMTLAALDEIGSYHIVRQLREEKRG